MDKPDGESLQHCDTSPSNRSAVSTGPKKFRMLDLLGGPGKRIGNAPPPRLYTEVAGAGGETLVFLAGLGGTTRNWSPRIAPLAGKYRIVLVDLLGFGESPKPWTRYSVDRHVAALHDTLASLGPFTLIGHSLGALLTVAYAARFPQQVKNMVLMSLPYFGSEERAYRYLRNDSMRGGLRGLVFTNMALTMIACIISRRVMGKILPYLIREIPRDVVEDLVKHTWRSSTSSLWEVVYRYDALEDVRRLPKRIDVLCIHGDNDTTAPLSSLDLFLEQQPNWSIELLPGIDHHPFLRDTTKCIELIEDVAQQIGARQQ